MAPVNWWSPRWDLQSLMQTMVEIDNSSAGSTLHSTTCHHLVQGQRTFLMNLPNEILVRIANQLYAQASVETNSPDKQPLARTNTPALNEMQGWTPRVIGVQRLQKFGQPSWISPNQFLETCTLHLNNQQQAVRSVTRMSRVNVFWRDLMAAQGALMITKVVMEGRNGVPRDSTLLHGIRKGFTENKAFWDRTLGIYAGSLKLMDEDLLDWDTRSNHERYKAVLNEAGMRLADDYPSM